MLFVKMDRRGRCEGFGWHGEGDLGWSWHCFVRGKRRGQDLGGDGVRELANGLAAARVEPVEVEGGRVDVAVAEEFGEGREIRSRQELQRCEGMPEGVGRRLLREFRDLAQALDPALDGADRDPGAARRDEEGDLSGRHVLRPLLHPLGDKGAGAVVEGELAQRPALPFDPEYRRGHEVHLVEIELHELVDPEARLGEEGQDREVGDPKLRAKFCRERAKAALKLAGSEHRWNTLGLAHEGDLLGGVAPPAEVAFREGGEDAHRRELLVARGWSAGMSITPMSAEERLDLGARGGLRIVHIAAVEREKRRDEGSVDLNRAGALGLGREVPCEGSEGVAHMTRG